MLNRNNRLEAATLPVVMVISVLILLVVLFVYSLWDMNFLYYSSYHYKKQQQENLNSAISPRHDYWVKNRNATTGLPFGCATGTGHCHLTSPK